MIASSHHGIALPSLKNLRKYILSSKGSESTLEKSRAKVALVAFYVYQGLKMYQLCGELVVESGNFINGEDDIRKRYAPLEI